jgi:hypothetical protein
MRHWHTTLYQRDSTVPKSTLLDMVKWNRPDAGCSQAHPVGLPTGLYALLWYVADPTQKEMMAFLFYSPSSVWRAVSVSRARSFDLPVDGER